MQMYEVSCLHYEICGSTATFDESEYDIYGDDYVCAECYADQEFNFFEATGWADSDSLASAGFGMDEDY